MNLTVLGVTLTIERLRAVAALFFVAVTVYLLSQSPWNEMSSYFDVEHKIQLQQAQIDAAKNLPITRAQLLARRQAILSSIEALRAKFPPRNQILSILLVDLSQIFHDSGVRLVSFEPSNFQPLEQGGVKDLGRITIDITARGEYPAFISLFDKLSRYDRVVRVASPSIVPDSAAGASNAGGSSNSAAGDTTPFAPQSSFDRTLDADFTLTTFALNR